MNRVTSSSDNLMSTRALLADLQDAATHSDREIADVLRMCIRLASAIDSEQLKEWAGRELRGYTANNIPEYRIITSRLLANFTDPLGRQLKHWQIPLAVFDEGERQHLSSIYLLDPISRVADLIRTSEDLGVPLPPERIARLQQQDPILEGWLVSEVWQGVPSSSLVAVLDQVRTRALEFACELESLVSSMDRDGALQWPPSDSIRNIFNTTIVSPNIATVGHVGSIHQTNVAVSPGDITSLFECLADHGVSADALQDLRTAIKDDADSKEQPGTRVNSWIARTMSKIGTGVTSVGSAASGQVIVDAIRRFLGLF